MSGGVDSSLCAHLLVEQGYEVTGVYLECWRAPGCRSEEDRKDALQVALDLGIPFKVLDFKQAYKEKVVEYFFNEYEAGRTPNPDVLCNKEIKFGLFYDWAMEHGFDAVATGHYGSLTTVSEPSLEAPRFSKRLDKQSMKNLERSGMLTFLTIPTDEHKDQTYFLYRLKQDQLDHIIFPLADLKKPAVRQLAHQHHIAVADKKDSVGICFIGDIDVTQFLKDRLGEKPGEVVDTQGNVIGTHRGIWFYTIGQRHGFEINKKTVIKLDNGELLEKENIPPFYVIGKDADKNELIVGFGSETYADQFGVTDLHWINGKRGEELSQNPELVVRIRHTGQLIPCQLNVETNTVTLDEPTKGVAEGQSAVFYTPLKNGSLACLGGGIITL